MTTKDKLQKFVERRHPLWESMLEHWNFVEATYEGGRAWFKDNIFRYVKEGDKEYQERIKRAYRFNHTRQAVELVDKYLFKMPIARRTDDVSEGVQAFWKNATLSGLDIGAYMKRVSTATSQYGRVYLVMDSNAEGGTFSKKDERDGKVRLYSYIVRPQEMLDMSYDESGEFRWVLIKEISRDDADPMESSGAEINRFRLWTTTEWVLFEERIERNKKRIVEVDRGTHGLGVVPVVQADHNFTEEQFAAPGLIDDIAYLDRAIANYLSNLDAIIQDQTFSQLAMPAQGLTPGDDGHSKLLDLGTKRVFTYDGQAGEPKFLSPDVKQSELILSVIGKVVYEVYHSIGLAAARTGDDNGGTDTESGISKAYDFEGVNALLAAKAGALEVTERRLAHLADLWNGDKNPDDLPQEGDVVYPRDFDVRGLYDEFEIAARLNLLSAPKEVRREQMSNVIAKLFPAASQKLKDTLDKALKDWPPEDAEGLAPDTKPTSNSAGSQLSAASTQKTAKELAA